MTLGPCHTLRHEASWIVPHRPTGKNFRSIFSVVNPGAVSPPSTILAGEMQDRRCRTEMQDGDAGRRCRTGDAGQEMQDRRNNPQWDRRCRTDGRCATDEITSKWGYEINPLPLLCSVQNPYYCGGKIHTSAPSCQDGLLGLAPARSPVHLPPPPGNIAACEHDDLGVANYKVISQ
jgi:hypothetical protein